ncbi:hypothetical protein BDZ90DRAFT_53710 [Jaminaea rosea]|uniref:DNA2/NAM7 helicase helicase domain-containing protein n=1 Tax=Jaminaea rosea TaxID=1569628 RepID=A0A316UM67_9BASI|nr:hypothetical protein BDZ90DRAFT_53710 [Jaminaea rosea]PWN26382.1 hypothetical protein BDZ90DRAFT_53710 [Jaminaea rosea]
MLVELERDHERREWERVRARSLDELVAEGRAMSGLVGYWQGGMSKGKARAPKARVGVFTREGMEKLGWSRLKEGDRVELSVAVREGEEEATGPQLQDLLPKEATISNAKKQKDNAPPRPAQLFATVLAVETHRLRLLFHPPNSLVDLEACPSWRIDLAPNDAIDVKIDEAIERLAVDAAALEASDAEGKLELQGTQLSAALVGEADERAPTGSMFEQDQLIRSWYTRYARPDPLVLDGDPDLRLNPSQLRAVATMLANRISLIQGPPGTGKTHTLVAALVLLKKHFAVAAPVLLSAHTNIAVDNLCEGAMRAGLEVVRVGPSSRLEEAGCTLEKKMEQHPLYTRLEGVRAQMAGIKRRLAALEHEGGEGQGQDHAHDPASTTSAASLRANLSPLIGDHRQLPAVVKSREAREQGGERSLFERLIEEGTTPSVMLEEQHRMHPELAAFSSQHFYEGKLRNAPSTEEIDPLALAAVSASRRLIFIDHPGLEHHHPIPRSGPTHLAANTQRRGEYRRWVPGKGEGHCPLFGREE